MNVFAGGERLSVTSVWGDLYLNFVETIKSATKMAAIA